MRCGVFLVLHEMLGLAPTEVVLPRLGHDVVMPGVGVLLTVGHCGYDVSVAQVTSSTKTPFTISKSGVEVT